MGSLCKRIDEGLMEIPEWKLSTSKLDNNQHMVWERHKNRTVEQHIVLCNITI